MRCRKRSWILSRRHCWIICWRWGRLYSRISGRLCGRILGWLLCRQFGRIGGWLICRQFCRSGSRSHRRPSRRIGCPTQRNRRLITFVADNIFNPTIGRGYPTVHPRKDFSSASNSPTDYTYLNILGSH